jgi:hypothetical protein
MSEAFAFEATVYKETENTRNDYLAWAVDKSTGNITVVNIMVFSSVKIERTTAYTSC